MVKNSISRLARAKINLDLLITGRRKDGYHLLDSLVVFADYGDHISVTAAEKLTLSIRGPFAGGLTGEMNAEKNGKKDNLILKAARGLQGQFDIRRGAKIELVKNLPVSSGIGGGSADAAAAIHALRELWHISEEKSGLSELCLSLGADVPVCMASETAQMSGVGERLSPVAIDFPLYLCLVNPGVGLSTADIFAARAKNGAAFSSPRQLPERISNQRQLVDILQASGNDLQDDAIAAQPEIKAVLAYIKGGDGCLFTGMSGSGATCFGIFSTHQAADSRADNIRDIFPDWWARAVCTA